MNSANWVQNLKEAVCISHSSHTLRKGINPTILPPVGYQTTRKTKALLVVGPQPYTYTCKNKINNDKWSHIFRKIYLSHFIQNGCERVACERWVGDWTNCNILTPSSFVFSSTSFSFCWVAQLGFLRAHSPLLGTGSLYSVLSPTNRTSCHTRLYHCLMPTCFLWALHLNWIQPVHGQGYILMSSTGCPCFSIDSWVEGQYVTFFLYH